MADGAVQPGVGLTDAGIEEIWAKIEAARRKSASESRERARFLAKRAIELGQQGRQDEARQAWGMRRNLMD